MGLPDKAYFQLSKIGLGLAALGRPGYINIGHGHDLNANYDQHRMEAQTHRMLDEARKLGINYFDVAQSYGKAENFLSSWLKTHQNEQVVVGSKWGYYYTAGWSVSTETHEIKEHTISRLNQQWPESRDRLASKLKLYQIHSATFESGVLENVEVLNRLAEIRDQGYLIGFSVSGVHQAAVIERGLEIVIDGESLFGSVQATYNVLEQSAADVLQKASERGLLIIIKEGVANGRLTNRNSEAGYFRTLRSVAEKYGVSEDAVALGWITSRPFVDVVLSGAATVEQLRSNIQAAELQLSEDEISQLDHLRMDSVRYWQERGNMEWN